MSTGVLARSLGDTRDASVLIPGDADAVRADARALDETAETLTTVAEGIGATEARGWTGKAAAAYSETTTAMRTRILVAANAMGSAASALHAHASTLEWAQDQARAAIRSFDAAAACAAPDLLATITPTAGQHLALASLDDARSQVHASANTAATALQDASVDAPIGPGLWNQVGYQWSELWHGAADSFWGMGQLAWNHKTVRRLIDPDGTAASDTALAAGLIAAVKDPVRLSKGVIDYDTWATSPARAFGHLAPDAAIAASNRPTTPVIYAKTGEHVPGRTRPNYGLDKTLILTSGLRRPLAVVATTAALILGTSAAAQAFTLADCYSGRGCTWSNNDYDGLTMTRHENAVSFGLVTNDTANSAASYGNTNCARFWEHGDYSGRYLDFQRPAIGGTYRDPNLANGGGSGGYTSDNWENIISSMNWRSC